MAAAAARRPRRFGGTDPGGGPAISRRLLALLLLLAALAQAADACVMRFCAQCARLPTQVGTGVLRLRNVCERAATGYATSPDRLSVPDCARGFAAKTRAGPCRLCNYTEIAPQAPIGLLRCTLCQSNTSPSQTRDQCIGSDGYENSGAECAVDHYCVGGKKMNCPLGQGTGNLTKQTSCDYVIAGFRWTGSAAAACDPGTYAPKYRAKTAASSCLTCPLGTSTGGGKGQTACSFTAKGYYNNGTGPAPCPADTYQGDDKLLLSSASACTNCSAGLSTNGYTAQGDCLWVLPGFSYSSTTKAMPCEAEKSRAGTAPANTTVPCSTCSTGYSTNGLTGQAACNYIRKGYYNAGNATSPVAVACPADSYQPSNQAFSALTNCTACLAGLTTASLLAQEACGFVRPGYYYSKALGIPEPCQAELYSDSIRNISSAPNCTACPIGLTTIGQARQVDCLYVLPGYYYANLTGAALCPANTYANTTRNATIGSTCTPCPTGFSTNGTQGGSYLYACAFTAAGYFNAGNGTHPPNVQPCPVDTYRATIRPLSDTSNCTKCPHGWSTANMTASTACPLGQLDPGYYLDPATSLPKACPPETFAPSPRLSIAAGSNNCTGCPVGSGTNGTTGNAACGFILPGFFYNGTGPAQCLVDSYQPYLLPQASATSCTNCVDGLGTGGLLGAAACNYVKAGWAFSGSPERCLAETAQPTDRLITSGGITDCPPCPVGLSTLGLDGQLVCLFTKPGFLYNPSINTTVGLRCPADTYMPDYRNRSLALNCTACPTGVATNGTIGQITCTVILPGYYNNGTFTMGGVLPCPPDTYQPYIYVQQNWPSACTACDPSLTTANVTASVDCPYVRPGYFWNATLNATSAQPCPVNTSWPTLRNKTAAFNCSACDNTTSTWNQTGALYCTNSTNYTVFSISSLAFGGVSAPAFQYASLDSTPGAPQADPSEGGGAGAAAFVVPRKLLPEPGGGPNGGGRLGAAAEPAMWSLVPAPAPVPPDEWPDGGGGGGSRSSSGSGSSSGSSSGRGGWAAASGPVAPGFWFDAGAGAAAPCPADAFEPYARTEVEAAAGCTPCPEGLTTGGGTGQMACRFVAPGYWWDAGAQLARPCPINTYSAAVRSTADAAGCSPCWGGLTTLGFIGQAACA